MKSFFSAALLFAGAVPIAAPAAAEVLRESALEVRDPVEIRFIDGSTGYSVQPEHVTVSTGGTREQIIHGVHGSFILPPGAQTISIELKNYRPFSAAVGTSQSTRRLHFVLEPLVEPERLQPDFIRSLHSPDATVFVGFVVDDDSRTPLADVRVSSMPAGVETETGPDGFFQLAVPLQSREEAAAEPANLLFEKDGYQMQDHRHIELWPNGDWTYRVPLKKGAGTKVIDENEMRRRPSPRYVAGSKAAASEGEMKKAPQAATSSSGEPMPQESAPTIRVPQNIRVLLEDNETVEVVPMELYVRRSLPREWIASWANYAGGSHSLRAGAVAIRTYAIGFVNNPRGLDHDICATTACQVYGSATNTHTDAAVSQTSHRVLTNADNAITLRMTEYSAENNSLGFSCGDGYTQPSGGCIFDPVCTGEERFGHGRGMCQWGSVRWATGRNFSGRNMSDPTTHSYPLKEWEEILEHYYPNLTLVEGAPFIVGETVRVARSSVAVRLCSGGGIESGIHCPQIASKLPGSTGTIVEGPVLVTADGRGHTWWKVRWNDVGDTTGWSPENWLERSAPPAPEPPPTLAPVSDYVVDEMTLLSFTASATAPDRIWPLTDFEEFPSSTANGTVLFRQPGFSGSTSGLLGAAPNSSAVTANFPPGNDSSRALHAAWSWTSSSNPWLRLTTSNTSNLANPVIDFTKRFRFRIHSDRDIKVALGVRETATPSGTPIGADGGTDGDLEFVGAPGKNGSAPNPSRTVTAGAWTTVEFDIPNEPVSAFVGGDGLLSTASGLGVLEHLAFVPAAGIGEYHIYLDDFAVVEPRRLTFSLDSGAPDGATIDPVSGLFAWTPTEAQGPGIYTITVRVSDDGSPSQSDAQAFQVTVNEVNHAPVLASIPDRTVHAGATVAFEASATDPDIPANTLTFSLDPGAPSDAVIEPVGGAFSWMTTQEDAGGVFSITVRVTDDGSPSMSDTETFTVTVTKPLVIHEIKAEEGGIRLTWEAIEGATYRVQYKSDLHHPDWIDLQPDIVAAEGSVSIIFLTDAPRKFFRIQLVNP